MLVPNAALAVADFFVQAVPAAFSSTTAYVAVADEAPPELVTTCLYLSLVVVVDRSMGEPDSYRPEPVVCRAPELSPGHLTLFLQGQVVHQTSMRVDLSSLSNLSSSRTRHRIDAVQSLCCRVGSLECMVSSSNRLPMRDRF